MGVSWLFHYPLNNRTANQAVADIELHLSQLGAEPIGVFSVDSDQYHPAHNLTRDVIDKGNLKSVHLLHSSEFPHSSFAIVDGVGSADEPWLVADRLTDQIFVKLQSCYAPRPNNRIELHGTKHRLIDFVIKVGTVSIAAVSKGVVVEIEYEAAVYPHVCREIMKEFSVSVLGPQLASTEPPRYITDMIKNTMPSATKPPAWRFGAIDIMRQYQEQFAKMRQRLLEEQQSTLPQQQQSITNQQQQQQQQPSPFYGQQQRPPPNPMLQQQNPMQQQQNPMQQQQQQRPVQYMQQQQQPFIMR